MLRVSYVILAIVVVAGLLLWPQSLGGEAAYVTYNQGDIGSGLQAGDLAIVRRARAYEAGDLVAVKTSDGPPIFGWVADAEKDSCSISFRARGELVDVEQLCVLGRLWINLGDVGRGIVGTVLNYFGMQAATAR